MKSFKTYEVYFEYLDDLPGQSEIIHGQLVLLGVPKNEIIEVDQQEQTKLSVYFTKRDKAEKFKRRCIRASFSKVKFGIRSLESQDWQTKWQDEFKPFALSKRFDVVPFWQRDQVQRKKECIYIDTSIAFGTGLHATTQLMVGFIERYTDRLGNFLDVGTGTGILSIAAFKCNAESVRAIDISRDCVKSAKLNFKINQVSGSIFREGIEDIQTHAKFDYVAANLVTDELIENGRRLVSLVKPGQYLAVSGISLDNFDRFRKAFRRWPLRCLKISKKEDWSAILYKKVK